MSDNLRLLIVEDSEDDAALLVRTLRRAGHHPIYQRVASAEALRQALRQQQWDLVISDYTLPHFDGLKALEIIQQSYLDIPFIIVSGTINEEMAVAAIKAGAHDYVLKDNLQRIVPAVERELGEAKMRLSKREAESQVRIQRHLLDQVHTAVVAIDRQLRVIYWNRQAEKLYGWMREEALGQHILDLTIRPADIETARLNAVSMASGKNWEGDVLARCKGGTERPVHTTNSPLFDEQGELLGFVSVAVDITERKRVEEERAELLAREQAAREEAEAANRAKDEFLATVSHELRTPLNAMIGWIYLLRTGKLDDRTRERALETVERNTRLQAQLIEDLLDVSRIIAGKLRLNVQPCDPESVIAAALESVRLAAESRELELRFHSDNFSGLVLCDPDRMQQVIWNLLANAIKFTSPGGQVIVCLRRHEGQAELSVRDTGQGISPDFLPFVFDRFRQADSTATRSHGGIGLGLSIVRHLVELHGGTVAASSKGLGQGSEFIVRLPLITQSLRTVETIRREDLDSAGNLRLASLDGLRVLVVEDDKDAREMLTTLLQRCRVIVESADSVAAAIHLFELHPPDILVSDLGMPQQDGFSMIRRIRQLSPDRGGLVPAIALTAYAREEDRAEALAAGFQAHLAKPVEPAELTAVLVSLAHQGRSA
jgi:PAS domain S-box-containing protein